jgi:Spy/CpxP family protein refolding chaperone
MKQSMFILLSVLAFSATAFAQQNSSDDPFAKAFFPPELVMQNQVAIHLTDAQRSDISKEMQNAQAEFVTLQWDLQKESEKLKSLIEKENPIEASVTDQLGRVLDVENKIKKKQISLMVRIKNLLTHEQQLKLQQLRSK